MSRNMEYEQLATAVGELLTTKRVPRNALNTCDTTVKDGGLLDIGIPHEKASVTVQTEVNLLIQLF